MKNVDDERPSIPNKPVPPEPERAQEQTPNNKAHAQAQSQVKVVNTGSPDTEHVEPVPEPVEKHMNTQKLILKQAS